MMEQDAPTCRCPDISLAKAKIHREPTIALRDGLVRTIEYFRSQSGVLPGKPLPVDRALLRTINR